MHHGESVHTVIIIGIDDGEGLVYIGTGAQRGMHGAKGLYAPGGHGVEAGQGGEILHGVVHLKRAARFGAAGAHQLAAQRFNQWLHFRFDNKDNLIKARAHRVEQRVFHQHFMVGADAFGLLVAAVSAAKPGGHDDQGGRHANPPQSNGL